MKFQPLQDKVLLQKLSFKPGERKVGSIILADTVEPEGQYEAKVIAVGPGRITDKGIRIPMTCKPGDRVMLTKWVGADIEIEGEKYIISDEQGIAGIL